MSFTHFNKGHIINVRKTIHNVPVVRGWKIVLQSNQRVALSSSNLLSQLLVISTDNPQIPKHFGHIRYTVS